MKSAIREIGKGTFRRAIDPFYAGAAAEFAFLLILSLVPATFLLAQILQLFTLSMEAAETILGLYVSEEVYDVIAPLLDYTPNKGVSALLILLALWSGSQGVFSLMRITNRAYDVIPKTGNPIRWVIEERLRAVLLTLLMLVTMIFALYILVYGEVIVRTSVSYSNEFLEGSFTFSEVWYGVRWVIAFILFFITVFSLYYILPRSGVIYAEHHGSSKLETARNIFAVWMANRKQALKLALPGSIFAAVLMLGVTRLYTFYVRYTTFNGISLLYGGLSIIVFLLLWLYVMSYIVVTGIQVNAANIEYISKTGAKLK